MDTGPGDTGPEDAGMPQICESCRDTSNCPAEFECQTIDDNTGQRACLPTCGRDEFDTCPAGWACVGPTNAGVCFPARGCCTAQNVGVDCEGEGVCGAGVIECDDDGGARCSTEPGGSADESVAELCNGLDDDCDGEVDEAFLVGDPCDGRGACGAGTVQCDPNDATDMTTICSTEPGGTQNQAAANDLLCNGIDDDCDGRTDEDRGVGMVCDGAGACGAGELECATINTTRCSTDPGGSAHNPGGQDICDGADNDCDNNVDEGFGTGVACPGIGECGAGLVECATANTTRCSTHPGGTQFTGAANDNTCDSLDNDCDGDIDEDLGIGNPCDPPGACGAGVFECNGAMMPVCNTGPGGSMSQAQTERCNGVNDDCDADTDEGFNLGTFCDPPGNCGGGVYECHPSNGMAICSTGPGGSSSEVQPEVCDGQDQDCNSVNDNGSAASLCPPTANVSTTSCNGGAGCAIVNCASNRYDADVSYNTGCECEDTEAGSLNACAVDTNDLDLALNTTGTLNGIIISGSDSDWYQVRVAAGQTAGLEVTFGSNPSTALRFEIDQGGCTQNPACGAGVDLTRTTRNNCAMNQGGLSGCTGGGVETAYVYYIRVYRAATSNTCIPYSLTVRAASTNI